MRLLCIILISLCLSATAVNAQDVQAENFQNEHSQKVNSVEQTPLEEAGHKYICQRCGTENLMNWSFSSLDEHLDLIPHCTFCGKKYWPKFKPSGFLQRTFCRTGLGIINSEIF